MRMLLSALLCLSIGVAQDPEPPPGGFLFALREFSAASGLGPIAWVDGTTTALDVYHPLGVPPATGWPVVLLVHGGSGNRKIPPILARARLLAAAGYVCLAYDVRGEGVTPAYNPLGFDASEEARLRDMAEVFARSNAWLPAGVTADITRLAVTGESMGGRHAFRAAGWSGQPLPVPMGVYTHMPLIAAVAPRIAPLDVPKNGVEHDLLNAEVAVGTYERGPGDPFYAWLVAEDFAAIEAGLAADPLRNYLPRLLTTTVPMLITNCWDDAKHQLSSTVNALPLLPANTPVHTYWTTNGHGTSSNDGEQLANDESIRRWFDHFLKARANGVPFEPRHESGYAPPHQVTHLDPTSHWPHALEPNWPPTGMATTSLYLHTGGGTSLTGSAPIAVEPAATVSNTVLLPGYDILAFCAAGRSPTATASAIALDNEVFTTAPFSSELELLGRARFTATVDTTAGDFQVTAALYAMAPAGGGKLITAGTAGLRGGVAGTHALSIELDDTAFLVPAGYRLRLVLRNLPIYDFPGNTFVRWVPCFVAGTTSVRVNVATPGKLELPTRPRAHAFLTPRIARTSAALGVLHNVALHAGASRAGQSYLVLLSASGFGPGTFLAPEQVPINLDAFTWLVLGSPGPPFFPGFAGVLDASGNAAATVDLTAIVIPPFLLGMRFTLAPIGLDAGGYWGGGPAQFDIQP